MSNPLMPFIMISEGPPCLVAITGTPHALASIIVRPNGSIKAGLTNIPFFSARYL